MKPEPEGLQLHLELHRGGAKIAYHSQHNAMTEKRCKLQLKCILMKHMIPYDISKTHVRMRRYEHILRGAGLGSVVSMLDKKPVELRLLLHKFGCTARENWALPAVCSRT